MKGLNLSRGILVLLLLWTLSVVAGAAGAVSTERGGAGRSQRRGGGGGGGGSGADKRRRFHRIQHGQCSYTFILPELDGCQSGGSEQYGGSRGGASIVQRDSPPVDGEWSAQKLQHLESTMENNTQWLRKRMDKKKVTKNLLSDKNGQRSKFRVMTLDEWQLVSIRSKAGLSFFLPSMCGVFGAVTGRSVTRAIVKHCSPINSRRSCRTTAENLPQKMITSSRCEG